MTNPLLGIDIGDFVLDVVGDVLLDPLTCGIFPQVGPGQSCQGISFGQNCCAGLVTGPGDIQGGDFCPPGTQPQQGTAGNIVCVSSGGDPFNGGNGQVNGGGTVVTQANGKICCPSGKKPAADGSGKCVTRRKTNFGNAKAARNSVRRLTGSLRLLRGIESLVEKSIKPPKRKSAPRARRKDPCAC